MFWPLKNSISEGDPPVALAVLRDETVEEWERVALLQASVANHVL